MDGTAAGELGGIVSCFRASRLIVFCFPIIAPDDYTALAQIITLDSVTTSVHLMININDDMLCEADERFEIMLTSLNDNCAVTSSSVPVYTVDNDGKY